MLDTFSISFRERQTILIVALAMCIFSFAGMIFYDAKDTYQRHKYFTEQEKARAEGKPSFSGPYCYPDYHPQRLLSVFTNSVFTLPLIFLSKRYLLSLASSLYLLSIYGEWFSFTRKLYEEGSWLQYFFLDSFFYNSSYLDFNAFFYLLILIFWQILILLRMIMSEFQSKISIP